MKAKPNPWFIICKTFTVRAGCNFLNLLHQVVAVAEEIGLEVQVIAFNNTYAHVIVKNCFPIVYV
jgi:hypothetical protein